MCNSLMMNDLRMRKKYLETRMLYKIYDYIIPQFFRTYGNSYLAWIFFTNLNFNYRYCWEACLCRECVLCKQVQGFDWLDMRKLI